MKTIKIRESHYNIAKIAVEWINSIYSETCPEFKTTIGEFIENAIADKIKMYHDLIESYRYNEIKKYDENKIIQ